jgi:hypothetical protein
LLAGFLSLLRERVKLLVEGPGGDKAGMEEMPGAAVTAGVLVVLGEGGASRVEHRVVGGADGSLAVPGCKGLLRQPGAVARLVHELL